MGEKEVEHEGDVEEAERDNVGALQSRTGGRKGPGDEQRREDDAKPDRTNLHFPISPAFFYQLQTLQRRPRV